MKKPNRKKTRKRQGPTRTMGTLSAFQDDRGRVAIWPSDRRSVQQVAVLEYLAAHFEGEREYSAAEVEALLRQHSTLDDLAMLRGELLESDYLMKRGETYWRSNGRPRVGGGVTEAEAELA